MPSIFQIWGELDLNTGKFERAAKAADGELRALRGSITATEQATKGMSPATHTAARAYERLQAELQKAETNLKEVAAAYNRGTATSRQMGSAVRAFDNALERVNSRLRDQAARLKDTAAKKQDFIESLFAGVTAANLASAAISRVGAALTDGAKAVFDYANRVQQSKIAFESLTNNSQLAAQHVKELEKLARSSPLQFESIAKMSQRLQGAGIEAGKVIPLLKDIGNVAAATGDLSAERMEGIGTALSQIASKGRVSAEEMEQLAERGVPAWRILSQAIGKTVDVTREMAKDGEITSDQLFKAFQQFSRLNFGDAMQKQAQTFSGSMQLITNIVIQAANSMFEPVYKEIGKFSAKVAESLQQQENDPALKAAGVSFGMAIGVAIGDGIARSNPRGSGGSAGFVPGQAMIELLAKHTAELIHGIQQGYQSSSDPLNQAIKGWQDTAGKVEQALRNYMAARQRLQAEMDALKNPALSDAEKDAAKKAADEAKKKAEAFAKAEADATMNLARNNLRIAQDEYAQFLNDSEQALKSWGGLLRKPIDTVLQLAAVGAKNIRTALRELEAVENKGRAGMGPKQIELLDQEQAQRIGEAERRLKMLNDAYVQAYERTQQELATLHDTFERSVVTDAQTLTDYLAIETAKLQKEWDIAEEAIGTPPPLDLWQMFWFNLKRHLGDFKNSLPSIKQSLGENLINSIQGVGDVFGNALNDWATRADTFFGSLVKGFRQMISQIISELVRLMVMRAVLSLLGSFGGVSAGGVGSAAGDSITSQLPGIGMSSAGGGMDFGGFGFSPALAGASYDNSSSSFSPVINVTMPPGSNTSRGAAEQIARTVLRELHKVNNRNK